MRVPTQCKLVSSIGSNFALSDMCLGHQNSLACRTSSQCPYRQVWVIPLLHTTLNLLPCMESAGQPKICLLNESTVSSRMSNFSFPNRNSTALLGPWECHGPVCVGSLNEFHVPEPAQGRCQAAGWRVALGRWSGASSRLGSGATCPPLGSSHCAAERKLRCSPPPLPHPPSPAPPRSALKDVGVSLQEAYMC